MRLLLVCALVFVTAAARAELRLVDDENQPVAAARVQAVIVPADESPLSQIVETRRAAVSRADGVVPLRLPAAGRVVVIVDHPAFAPRMLESVRREIPREIRLERGRTWRGRVDGAEPDSAEARLLTAAEGTVCASGRILSHAKIEVGKWQRCTRVDRDGVFRLDGLPAGTIKVEAQVAGFLPFSGTIDPLRQTSVPLERGVLLSGTVADTRGRPVAGSLVVSSDGARVQSATNGRFALAVRALPVRLELRAAGFRSWNSEITRSGEVAVRLTPSEQVFGTLLGAHNEPITEAVVWIERRSEDGGRRTTSRTMQIDDGEFVVDLPAPGTYLLRFRAPGHKDLRLPSIHVAAQQAHSLGALQLIEGAGVRAVVVDRAAGTPVEGASLEIVPAGTRILHMMRDGPLPSDVSNDAGEVATAGLDIGRYLIRVRRDGYATHSRMVDLQRDEVVDLGSVLLERGVEVHGRVLGREGNPRSGLQVRVFDPAHEVIEPFATATSGAEGRYRLPPIAPGRYRLQVRSERVLLAQEIDVNGGEGEREIDLLVGGVRLRGVVTRDAVPVGHGSIRLVSALDPGERRGKITVARRGKELAYGLPETALVVPVGEEGSFAFDDSPVGLVRLTYLGPGGERVFRTLAVPDSADVPISFELEGHRLQGRVVEADTRTGVSAAVRLFDAMGRFLTEVLAERDGAFAFQGLAAGEYVIEARGPGYEAARGITVKAGADASEIVVVALQRGEPGTIAVALKREDGAGLEGIPISIFDARGQFVASLPSGGSGERTFENLAAGQYLVAWSEPLAGVGASAPVEVGPFRRPTVTPALGLGTSVVVVCPHKRCAGAPIELLEVISEKGLDLTPLLSGVSPGLRFSEAGDLSLGRLERGRYVVRLWAAGQQWERQVTVAEREARITLH